MEVVTFSRGRILRNFAGYIPLLIFSVLFYWVLIAWGLVTLLEGNVRGNLVRPVSMTTAALFVLVGCVWFVWFDVSNLARFRLSLRGDVVLIRHWRFWRLVERQFHVGELKEVIVGEGLNAVERVADFFGDLPYTRDLKAGRLRFIVTSGRQTVIHLADKAFEQESLREFVAELTCRGVAVSGTSVLAKTFRD